MALRSVLTIDVDDGAFKAFKSAFDKYQAEAAKMPNTWKNLGKEQTNVVPLFEKAASALMKQAEAAKHLAAAEKESERLARNSATIWTGMAHSTRSVANNIAEATRHLLRWGSLVGAVGGLLGVGGLFGIDRFAAAIAGNARSARSLGVSYGARQAFSTDFGQMVNGDAFLSNVANMMGNINASANFAQMGIAYAGRTPDAVAVDMLKKIRQVVKTSNPAMLRQALDIAGLSSVPLDQARAIGNTSQSVFDADLAHYPSDRAKMELQRGTQDAFTQFTQQLDRARKEIENVFGVAIKPLIPSLHTLSKSFESVIASFLAAPGMKHWITGTSDALEHFAKFVGTSQFAADVHSFAANVGLLAKKIAWGVHLLGGIGPAAEIAGGALAGGKVAGVPGAVVGGAVGAGTALAPAPWKDTGAKNRASNFWWGRLPEMFHHSAAVGNPFGLTLPGTNIFRPFKSDADAERATAAQLLRYQDVYHLDTIRGIVNRWAPASAGNDTKAYIADMVKFSGIGADQHLDLHHRDVMARIESALARRETNTRLTPGSIKLNLAVSGLPGGSTINVANQLGGPRLWGPQ